MSLIGSSCGVMVSSLLSSTAGGRGEKGLTFPGVQGRGEEEPLLLLPLVLLLLRFDMSQNSSQKREPLSSVSSKPKLPPILSMLHLAE